jgi:hypothetical protein
LSTIHIFDDDDDANNANNANLMGLDMIMIECNWWIGWLVGWLVGLDEWLKKLSWVNYSFLFIFTLCS